MQKIFFLFLACVLMTAGTGALADPLQYSLKFLGEGIKVEGMNEFGLVTGWRLSPSPREALSLDRIIPSSCCHCPRASSPVKPTTLMMPA